MALGAGAASAATTTGSFQVTLNVQGACSVQSAGTLDFGAHTALPSNVDATSVISVQCTNTTPYTIALGAGSGAGASVASRVLTAGSATLPYTIYQNASRTQLWGQTANVDTLGGVGSGAVQTYTVYGRALSASNPAAGAYTDTVAVTVTY